MQDATLQRAARIREFNRFYTNIIGLVNKTILDSPTRWPKPAFS
jgi:hypothetical protein